MSSVCLRLLEQVLDPSVSKDLLLAEVEDGGSDDPRGLVPAQVAAAAVGHPVEAPIRRLATGAAEAHLAMTVSAAAAPFVSFPAVVAEQVAAERGLGVDLAAAGLVALVL